MPPIEDRHVECAIRLSQLLHRWLILEGPSDLMGGAVSVQNPVRLGEGYEPQPDLVLLRDREGRTGTPRPEDVLLLIEVSDTTLRYDREAKLPLYARSGIPEDWIVDLSGGAVERHNVPSEGGYRRIEKARRKETLGSERLPGFVLQVDAVLV
jgi:Uma2 family endonuclease